MTDLNHSYVELLAPAGGLDSLRAAVANGADAVYLGVDRLNARQSAANFTLEELGDVCRFAHLRGVRVYLTANVLILPDEIEDAVSMVDTAWAAGIDGVIVQDLGLMRCIRSALPHVALHVSTQVNAHSWSTIRELAAWGVHRVTLARETSIKEVASWSGPARDAGVELESFVHGAICVSYSGQCLLSSLIGGRSANRGRCAQPCRLAYELVDGSGDVLASPGGHLLSPKDLAGIALLPQLLEAGVSSLKIEGRMKSAEYVAVVTGVYRTAIDRAASVPEAYEVREGELSALSEAFSRGFTEAYLAGERGNAMMSYVRPNNRGVMVGRITAMNGREATVVLETALSGDDTIEVWTGRGRFAQKVGPLKSGDSVLGVAPAGARVVLGLAEPAGVGDRVFRVRNASLADAAARTFADPAGVGLPVDVTVRMVDGEPTSVTVSDEQGRSGTARGETVEAARTRPVSAQDVIDHVGRFGGTAYQPRSWDVQLSPGVGIAFSELHRVRRRAIDDLELAVLSPWSDRKAIHPVIPGLVSAARTRDGVRLVASAASMDVAEACHAGGADSVHVPAIELGTKFPEWVVPVLSRISHDADEQRQLRVVSEGRPVVAGTIGLLAESARRGAVVEAHWALNAVNAHTVAQLAELGATRVWLSPELSSRQIAQIAAHAPAGLGFAVAGHQEVMVTEHCVLMAEGECSRACDRCARRVSPRRLRDRKGYELPVSTDRFGRSHLYNAVPLDLTGALPELLGCGVTALRVDVETLDARAARTEVQRVRKALDAAAAGHPIPPAKDRSGVTSGHFFRGVS